MLLVSKFAAKFKRKKAISVFHLRNDPAWLAWILYPPVGGGCSVDNIDFILSTWYRRDSLLTLIKRKETFLSQLTVSIRLSIRTNRLGVFITKQVDAENLKSLKVLKLKFQIQSEVVNQNLEARKSGH